MTADMYNVQMGQGDEGFGIESQDRFANEADLVAKFQDFRCLTNSAVICNFYPITSDELAELLTLVTGWTYSVDDLKRTGERIFTLMRLFNLKMGYNPKNEKLPDIVLQPLKGPSEGHVPDVEAHLSKWYQYRGWDRKTGKPPRSKIKELGLSSLQSQ
jgi:aldehyde:ferredoxin oxidoreductase